MYADHGKCMPVRKASSGHLRLAVLFLSIFAYTGWCHSVHAAGGQEAQQAIFLSAKALAHLREPIHSMPRELNAEISAVMKRHFDGLLRRVLGGAAKIEYNAVTTFASGRRDWTSKVNRLDMTAGLPMRTKKGSLAQVSVYINIYINEKHPEYFARDLVRLKERIQRELAQEKSRREYFRKRNKPFKSRLLKLGPYIAWRDRNGWQWSTPDAQMKIKVRSLDRGIDSDWITARAKALHAGLTAAGLYNFRKRLWVYRAGEAEAVTTEADCAKSGELTKYIKALRDHKKKLSSIDKEIDRLLEGPEPDQQTLINFGKKALSVGTAYYKTLKSFQRAETRRGLFEELDLVTTNSAILINFTVKYRKLAKVSTKPVDEKTITNINRDISKTVLNLAKQQAAARLKSEGLQDILISESWGEAVEKAAYHADRKVQEYLERETKKIFGLAFYDVASAKRALRLQMRREVRRQVAKLLVKITSNEIIIELAAGPIIRWIGRDLIPKLREALRPKGNLKNRVDRSVGTLRTARNDLNKLTCDAKLRDVRQTLRKANGAVLATKYLDRDLRKANNAQLLGKLADTRGDLERTIRITNKRFLLHKNDYEEDLNAIVAWVARDLNNLKKAISDDRLGTTSPPSPQNCRFERLPSGSLSMNCVCDRGEPTKEICCSLPNVSRRYKRLICR
ncbi:MAG: hypothetical protein ACE5I9_03185 [Candidatus Methylomirabilales bacterium]